MKSECSQPVGPGLYEGGNRSVSKSKGNIVNLAAVNGRATERFTWKINALYIQRRRSSP